MVATKPFIPFEEIPELKGASIQRSGALKAHPTSDYHFCIW